MQHFLSADVCARASARVCKSARACVQERARTRTCTSKACSTPNVQTKTSHQETLDAFNRRGNNELASGRVRQHTELLLCNLQLLSDQYNTYVILSVCGSVCSRACCMYVCACVFIGVRVCVCMTV